MEKPYIFQPKDYEGEFNLRKMERSLIVKVLSKTKSRVESSFKIGISKSCLMFKMKAHQIKESEWKKN